MKGWKKMSASAIFDSNFYLTNNADVVVAISQGNFANALDHFNQFGGKELGPRMLHSTQATMQLITTTF
jgi:hypothetical protein